jgi:ADP-heptose:LPS heptosyltransferase
VSTAALPVTFAPPVHRVRPGNRPALLVAEFRGVGDIAILIPFLRAALTRYDVTLLAVPNAAGLLRRFAPEVELIPCVAPWALFSGGRNLPRWPWRTLGRILRELRFRRFAAAVSIWPLASDHVFLRLARPGRLLGYGRRGAGWLLDENLANGGHIHRPEAWRRLAEKLGLPAVPAASARLQPPASARRVVLHSGASQALRIWPLARYAELLSRLRGQGWEPVVLCDPSQVSVWHTLGEPLARAAGSMDELVDAIAGGDVFLGNDSGPGHIAALCGVPTFTIFGPQIPELFAPDHPQAAWIEGRPCPYKPCFDRCRYSEPFCLTGIDVESVWAKLTGWLNRIHPVQTNNS